VVGANWEWRRSRGHARHHLQQGCAMLDGTGIEDPLITRWGRAALKSAGG